MKTKTILFLTVALLGLSVSKLHAQIAINNSANNPDSSAILDLKSGNSGVNKGFLPNSVALTDVTLAAPVVHPATGLIVYSSSAPNGGNGAGYYYWDGTIWRVVGNSVNGSNPTTLLYTTNGF
jgi:hypothetical protein